ncbi:MAG: anti-sigma factor [Chitinophagaceae bacterium]|nr:anti-sigma factor [Chitinophagaceae bacterium]
MENRNQHHELLVKYLLNESDIQEKIFVENWVEESEENRQYFTDLSNVLKLVAIKQTIDTVDVEQEWKEAGVNLGLRPAITALYPSEQETDIEETIEGKGRLRKILIALSAAACLVLLAGIGWQFLAVKKQDGPGFAKAKIIIPKAIQGTLIRNETNRTKQPRILKLEDGSEIILAPQSTVSFQDPFTGNKRDIILTGQADFKVAKDKTKPFTVFSKDISTTALGTRFTVTSYLASNSITIKLYEGKVVVKSVNEAEKKMAKDVYLMPGEQLVYNRLMGVASVSSFRVKRDNNLTENKNLSEDNSIADNPVIFNSDKTPWYMFNNQALPMVLEQLKEMYQVDIVYAKKDVRNMYFIGKFNKSDSVEAILKQISALNNLKVTRVDNKFFIKKIK